MKDKILPATVVMLAVVCFSYAAFEVNVSAQHNNNTITMPKMENLSVQRFERSDPSDTRAQDLVNKVWPVARYGDAPTVRLGNWRSEGPYAYSTDNDIYIREDLYKVLAPGALKEILAHEMAHIAMSRSGIIVGFDHRVPTHGDTQFHDQARWLEEKMR